MKAEGERQERKGRRQRDEGRRGKAEGRGMKAEGERQKAVSYDLRSPPRMKVRTFYLEGRRQKGKDGY
jgi:hypothetical protein